MIRTLLLLFTALTLLIGVAVPPAGADAMTDTGLATASASLLLPAVAGPGAGLLFPTFLLGSMMANIDLRPLVSAWNAPLTCSAWHRTPETLPGGRIHFSVGPLSFDLTIPSARFCGPDAPDPFTL